MTCFPKRPNHWVVCRFLEGPQLVPLSSSPDSTNIVNAPYGSLEDALIFPLDQPRDVRCGGYESFCPRTGELDVRLRTAGNLRHSGQGISMVDSQLPEASTPHRPRPARPRVGGLSLIWHGIMSKALRPKESFSFGSAPKRSSNCTASHLAFTATKGRPQERDAPRLGTQGNQKGWFLSQQARMKLSFC